MKDKLMSNNATESCSSTAAIAAARATWPAFGKIAVVIMIKSVTGIQLLKRAAAIVVVMVVVVVAEAMFLFQVISALILV